MLKTVKILSGINAVGFLLLPVLAFAQLSLPPGTPVTQSSIEETLSKIASFLIAISLIGGFIVIVAAGIMYFTSGFSSKGVEKWKEMFKNALIGLLIVLGVGVIINTIAAIISGGFFRP